MTKISNKVIEKIEKERIQPIGKWSFVLRGSFFWMIFLLNIIFGSLGFAIVIYLLEMSDIFNLILSVNDFLEVLVLSLPSIWFMLIFIFLIIGYINFKYTERGYIFSFSRIFILNLLIIFFLGIFLHSTGVSRKLNEIFSEAIDSYNLMVDPRYRVWNRPEEGYITGKILSIEEGVEKLPESLQIEDLNRKKWKVNISNARVRRSVSLEEGQKIKVRGNILSEDTFEASDILPWDGRKVRMQENHR